VVRGSTSTTLLAGNENIKDSMMSGIFLVGRSNQRNLKLKHYESYPTRGGWLSDSLWICLGVVIWRERTSGQIDSLSFDQSTEIRSQFLAG